MNVFLDTLPEFPNPEIKQILSGMPLTDIITWKRNVLPQLMRFSSDPNRYIIARNNRSDYLMTGSQYRLTAKIINGDFYTDEMEKSIENTAKRRIGKILDRENNVQRTGETTFSTPNGISVTLKYDSACTEHDDISLRCSIVTISVDRKLKPLDTVQLYNQIMAAISETYGNKEGVHCRPSKQKPYDEEPCDKIEILDCRFEFSEDRTHMEQFLVSLSAILSKVDVSATRVTEENNQVEDISKETSSGINAASLSDIDPETLTEEQWEAEYSRLTRLRKDIKIELTRIYGEDASDKWWEMVYFLTGRIRKNGYTKEGKFMSYHIIVWSGINQHNAPFIDFQGETAVIPYLEQKLEELKKKEPEN